MVSFPSQSRHTARSPVLTAYTMLTGLLTPLAVPLILLASLVRRKYRHRVLQRLGLSLTGSPPQASRSPRFWIHALSVGEITSALPLIQGVRNSYPDSHITLSVTTGSGKNLARQRASHLTDQILYAPFDLPWSVERFIRHIAPDLFILVETDFWPGWLHRLRRGDIPTLLVNGRFSAASLRAYQRFVFLSRPMFSCFDLLSLQTRADLNSLMDLGLDTGRLRVLGNLKYDAAPAGNRRAARAPSHGASWSVPTIVCGSTHPGEEEIILDAWTQSTLARTSILVMAPRDIGRCPEIEQMAAKRQVQVLRHSTLNNSGPPAAATLLLLDCYGELAAWYGRADLAFIGGSLVPQGGHNPLEAAAAGIPILYGPHMEDFAEISRDLIQAGAASVVRNGHDLTGHFSSLPAEPTRYRAMGRAGRQLVEQNQGVVQRHLDVITTLLA